MSYLSPIRIHFAGRFMANVTTGNNDISLLDPSLTIPAAPGWNPGGDGTWRLQDCVVTAAILDDQPLADDGADPIFQLQIADADQRVPAKMTDIDPMDPFAPTLYGLQLRLCTQDGATLLRGECQPATWIDPYYQRTPPNTVDGATGAAFQTVVTGLQWNLPPNSPFLAQFRAACADGILSLKFNLDRYDAVPASKNFRTGRIVGAIGPAQNNEPKHLVLGRHLLGSINGLFNPAVAVVDRPAKKLRIDVGNSLPNDGMTGPFRDVGKLTLQNRLGPGASRALGEIPYRSAQDWFERTAGIVTFSLENFSAQDFADLNSHPLELWSDAAPATPASPVLAEPDNGYYVRPDDTVFRMEPGGVPLSVNLRVTRFGLPSAAKILNGPVDTLFKETAQLMAGRPRNCLSIAPTSSDATGRAVATASATDPGSYRRFFDGQVYCRRFYVEGTDPENDYDAAHVLVWNVTRTPATWQDTVEPVFKYYARAYPTMNARFPMTNQQVVVTLCHPIYDVLNLPIEDARHMPVSRDLSPSKRKLILSWLSSLPQFGPS